MTEANEIAPHLTDAEIEAYWKGDLRGPDEERVEEHYVECAECGMRVAALETLIDSLRAESLTAAHAVMRLRAWQAAAAIFAALAVGAAWQWASRTRQPASVVARFNPGPVATLIVPLAPPTRAESVAAVTLSSDMRLVVFELDVREANAPAGPFDVSLARAAGRIVLRLAGAVPTDTGILRIPVDASFLSSGEYFFSATTGAVTIAIPFLIRPAGSG